MENTKTILKPKYENDMIFWEGADNADGYNVYAGESRFSTYRKIDFVNGNNYEVPDSKKYYKIAAVIDGVEQELSKPVSKELEMFGENVIFYSPKDKTSMIQQETDEIFAKQERAQFEEGRYSFMFKQGKYSNRLKIEVGFYTQAAGLGMFPTDTRIGKLLVSANWLTAWGGKLKNATCNFWRSMENITINKSTLWAVSQATSFRRMKVKGHLDLVDEGSWGSGGYIADTVVTGKIRHGGQQQWFNRNTKAASFTGTSWNLVNVGCVGKRGKNYTVQETIIKSTPKSAEKPYLVCDENNEFAVIVPEYKENTSGVLWQIGDEGGKKISIDEFYIAKPEKDTADTINAALQSGKNLIFTPGIYKLDKAIEVIRKDTVVLGMGYATLEAVSGTEVMKVADVSGIRIAGLLFEAGTTNSEVLLRVGDTKTDVRHTDEPIVLSDMFFRVGGANHTGKATCDVCVIINSNDVIGDHFWVWRADHGVEGSVGWNVNYSRNGLIVNGDNVIMYALMVEHFEEYQTIWNGNGGKTYLYQSEMPYDVPTPEDYMSHDGTVIGWASYKVSDHVTTHEAYGLGMYTVYRFAIIEHESAIEAPYADGVKIVNALTRNLHNDGMIKHVINDIGESTRENRCPTVKLFNNNYSEVKEN